jgi:hypothetical protein
MRSVRFKLAHNDAYQERVDRVKSLPENTASAWACKDGIRHGYHETQVTPLVEEIAIDVNAVWLTQILGDEGADGWQELLFKSMFILDVP